MRNRMHSDCDESSEHKKSKFTQINRDMWKYVICETLECL